MKTSQYHITGTAHN